MSVRGWQVVWIRALSIALAAVFALPSCMTMQLWSNDDRWRVTTEIDKRGFSAFLDKEGTGCILELPSPVARQVSALVPSLPATAHWVRVVPHGSEAERATLADFLALDAARRPLDWIALRISTEPGQPPRVSVHVHLFPGSRLRYFPELRWQLSLYGKTYYLDVACELVPLEQAPKDRGEQLRSFQIEHYAPTADGMHTTSKLALTPLALAGDVLLSPFELLFFLFP